MKGKSLRILLIINPISGTNSKVGLCEAIEKKVSSMGHVLETKETQGPGDATLIARKAAEEGYDVVLACGGDGTVNEIATGLIGTNTVLAILPNGSGNGLARHIGIPVDPIEALTTVKKGRVVDCDYCTVNDLPFFCTFGLGFDAAVSQKFAAGGKRGLMAYLKSTLDTFIHYKPDHYKITTDNKSADVDAFLIACCNASQYGNNAFIAPAASITDGVLDVTLIHSGNMVTQALVGVELIAGSISKGGIVDTFQTSQLTIVRPTAGIAHIDGEPVELPETLCVKCHHGGLKIFAPKKGRFRPLLTPALYFMRDCGLRISQMFSRR